MASTRKLRLAKSMALAALMGAFAFLGNASAQEKDAPQATWLRAGFVRPGADGKVTEGTVDSPLGGTIYFAVFQLPEGKLDPTDPYRTGLADLTKQFVAGAGSTKSPASLGPDGNLPKFLYLYQVVNDRGLDQSSKDGIRFAAQTEVKTREIGSLVLTLPIDAGAIQSWGYFKNAGFAINAIDTNASGKERPATLPPRTHLAVSANPSILVKLRDLSGQNYSRMASPIEFKHSSGFAVDRAGKNLKNSFFIEELAGRKTKLVAWEQESLKAAEIGGDVPDAVDLMKFTDGDRAKASGVLRTQFIANPLKAGRHSVLIGFTSNLPPGNGLARLQDIESAKRNTGIRAVSTDDIDFGAGGNIALPKDEAKDPAIVLGQKPNNLLVQGIVSPGDIPSGTKLVDLGSYKTFGGTVYFAVYKRISTSPGDSWGVGRADFDSLFVPGESYRASFSPRLDTDAEYLYVYQVVNDRGFHDFKLPQNKAAIVAPVAIEAAEERKPITREVASFSLFLRTDPRLITSWGYFDDSGFNVKVPNEAEIKLLANDPKAKLASIPMAVSSNLSILETLYPSRDKEYRSWTPPITIDFNRTTFGVGKDTLNINANRVKAVGNDRAGSLRWIANKTLDRVQTAGAVRPDYTQIIYFDDQNPVNGATIDGITLGPAEVARAVFKVDWLSKTITEGQQSVIFGFTSNVEPVRAPVRLKDLTATIKDSSEAQERTFLSPSQIKSLAMSAARANATGLATTAPAAGQAVAIAPAAAGVILATLNGDADAAAIAVADGLGQGIIPAGLGILARGSVGAGIAISPSVATPNVGAVGDVALGGGAGVGGLGQSASSSTTGSMGGAGFGGGFGGGVGAIGTARPATFGGGGFGGGSGNGSGGGSGGGSNQGSSGSNGKNNGSGSGNTTASNINNINFTVSQTNQQQQNQFQFQKQQQNQNQQQNGGGNVVPAPASLLLGLIGIPGLYIAYRRRRGQGGTPKAAAEPTPQEPQV